MASREIEIRITKLERDAEDGFWKCNVSSNGHTYAAHCKHGSWMVDKEGLQREVMPWVAKAIQERVRPIEKKERLAREKAQNVAA